MGDLGIGEDGGATFVHTPSFGSGDSFSLTLTNEGALELGDTAEDAQHELGDEVTGGGVCLVLFEELHGDAAFGEFSDDGAEVGEGASESVHTRDDEGVAVAEVAQRFVQLRSVSGAAALVVGVDARCPGVAELDVLAVGVLVGSADAGIADDLAGNARGVFARGVPHWGAGGFCLAGNIGEEVLI